MIREFYAQFVPQDRPWTAFDIGAHRGDKTAEFLAHGAERVLAVEPQSSVFRILSSRYETDNRVIPLQYGVGNSYDVSRSPMLMWESGSDTLSTFSFERTMGRFESYGFRSGDKPVKMVTLDYLFREFFEPDYIKIDVEGYEIRVIGGLNRYELINAISFEFDNDYEDVERCTELVSTYGLYEYNFTIGDVWNFALPEWVSRKSLLHNILSEYVRRDLLYGNIYARKKGSQSW